MVHAHLTPEGVEIAGEALPGRHELMRRLWDALDDEQLEQLVGLLDLVAERSADLSASRS
jgi:DNA-binding MarR family transcriptional regulator